MTLGLIKSCTTTINFHAAHRIIGHKNKCQFLHGHSYKLELTASSAKLNDLGMVVDFDVIKTLAGNWINDNFDHTTILNKEDKNLGKYIEECIPGQKVFYLNDNPTAENIAIFFKYSICHELFIDYKDEFSITKIKLFETSNSWVEV